MMFVDSVPGSIHAFQYALGTHCAYLRTHYAYLGIQGLQRSRMLVRTEPAGYAYASTQTPAWIRVCQHAQLRLDTRIPAHAGPAGYANMGRV
eukprot:1978176-Rhodomonas_salina.1